MSDKLAHGGIPSGRAPRAGGTQTPAGAGMVSPSQPFVDPTSGTLQPNTFRYLSTLLQRVSDLEARLKAANIP